MRLVLDIFLVGFDGRWRRRAHAVCCERRSVVRGELSNLERALGQENPEDAQPIDRSSNHHLHRELPVVMRMEPAPHQQQRSNQRHSDEQRERVRLVQISPHADTELPAQMPRHEHCHRAGQRNRGAKRIAVDSVERAASRTLEVMYERNTEPQVDDPLRKRDEGPRAMLADPKEHAP